MGAMEGPVSEGELDFNRQGAEASQRCRRCTPVSTRGAEYRVLPSRRGSQRAGEGGPRGGVWAWWAGGMGPREVSQLRESGDVAAASHRP